MALQGKNKLQSLSVTLGRAGLAVLASLVLVSGVSAQEAKVEFDLSLPVTYERCQMLDELNAYVKTLAPDDLEQLKATQAFLVNCQALLEEQISSTQQKLSELKASQGSTQSQPSASTQQGQ